MTLAQAQSALASVEAAILAKSTGGQVEEVRHPDGSMTRFSVSTLAELHQARQFYREQIAALGGTLPDGDRRPTILCF